MEIKEYPDFGIRDENSAISIDHVAAFETWTQQLGQNQLNLPFTYLAYSHTSDHHGSGKLHIKAARSPGYTEALTQVANVSKLPIPKNVISISYNGLGLQRALMVVTDEPPTIYEIDTTIINSIRLSRKYLMYDDTHHFDSSA